MITVCYNSEKHIEEAIKSVINQEYDNKEYIIVDGASKDNTLRIVEQYRDYIDTVISEPDNGISDAFNKGIKAATGEIICIVNSDDQMPEGALELFASQYEPTVDVYRGSEIIKDFKTGKEEVRHPTLVYPRIPLKFHVCHMATYIRRDAFERFGYYDTSFKCGMDRELLFRFHKMGAKQKELKGIFGVFRLGGVSQNVYSTRIYEAKELMSRMEVSRLESFIYVSFIRIKAYMRMIINTLKR